MRRASFLSALLIMASLLAAPTATSAPEYNFYFGNLHAHTSYSDGMGVPSDAYESVSTGGGMDFFSLTEHGYYFQEITNIHLWYKSIEEADLYYRPGGFVSLVGYEWTHAEGHMNGYGTPRAASRDTQRDLASFIEYLHENGGFATFNHPNPEIQPNWNDFSYWSYADEVVSMLEVGSGAYYRNTRNEPSYIKALDRGWKVGAVNNQDNHKDDWGKAANVRTGLIAKELNRESVMDAMRSMRTYSTEDRNVKAMLGSGESVMGDTVLFGGSGEAELELYLFAEDPDGEAFTSVRLITNGGKVAADLGAFPGGTLATVVHPVNDYNYYYAKLVQADGDTIITSPIWVETGSGVIASDSKVEDAFISADRKAMFYVRVTDRNGAGDLDIPYTLLADYGEGYIPEADGKVAVQSGRWSHLFIPWLPDKGGKVRLRLVLGSKAGDQTFDAGEHFVLESAPKGFAVDEGHNNRLTSYFTKLISLGRDMGYEGRVIEGEITSSVLEGLELLILPLPEQGFALKPTYYEESELKAVADWVKGGGSLLLLGWGDNGDGSREAKDFNKLLAMLGSGMEFGRDMLFTGGAPSVSATIELPAGRYLASFTEACSLRFEEGAERELAFIARLGGAEAKAAEREAAQNPAFAAGRAVGEGRVAAIGSVPFSDFEIGKPGSEGYGIAEALLKWLFEGRW